MWHHHVDTGHSDHWGWLVVGARQVKTEQIGSCATVILYNCGKQELCYSRRALLPQVPALD